MINDAFVGGSFTWFIGEIKDVSDPEKLNRVRVFPYGFLDTDKGKGKDLPLATVMMPNTSASYKGIGSNHQLLVGSWVVGFFRDCVSCQDPVIMGSIATKTEGITDIAPETQNSYPHNEVHKTVAGHLIEYDNTSGSERINIQHKTGTTININPDGTVFVNASNNTVDITGNTTIHGNLLVNGTTHSTGDVSTDAGNAPTLATHKHKEVPGTGGASSPSPTKAYTSEPFGGSAGPIQFDEDGNEIA